MPPLPQVDLVGVGLNATDTVIPVPAFPARGSKTEYTQLSILPGGQVASTVVACQNWGLSTRYVGKLGDDAAAALHYQAFARAGVETRITAVANASSPQSLILVDAQGERTVLCHRDPQDRLILQPEDLKQEWIVNARALHLDGHDTAAATVAARWAREAGVPVIADIDEPYPGIDSLLENIDHLIVSRDFPTRLTREYNLERALQQMQRRYKSRLTAATLGPDGVLAWDGEHFHYCPAYNVPVTDTTGAGDTFHAGYIYGFLQEWTLDRTLDFACAAAALNCMSVGARGGIKPVATIEHLMSTGEKYPAAEFVQAVTSAS